MAAAVRDPAPTPVHRRLPRLALVGLAVVAIVVGYVGVTFVQVWSASRQDRPRTADAIVVLGAAQYDGRPSPVLEARLDHALELYDEGLAGYVILTGGGQEGDRFSEAFSGFEYLRNEGVPEEALLLETGGTNTWEQLSASRHIMEDHGLEDAVLVSDPYHSLRLAGIADEVGMDATVSSTGADSSFGSLLRETAAVSLGRVIGYRRLVNWTS